MSYDTGDANQVRERKTKAEKQRDRELDDLKAVLATKSGRALLWRLMHHAKLYYDHAPSNDLNDTYFLMGQRHIALHIRREIIEADPRAFLQMEMEAGDY